MIIILLDNKRSDIAQTDEQAAALKCIRCGACLNACPIYKNVGGYTYNTTYSGPIGSVISPYFNGFDRYNHLSFACTVCGACTEVCPVKIPLHELLLLNRKNSVEMNLGTLKWDFGMKMYEFAFKNRKILDVVNGNVKNSLLNLNPKVLGSKKNKPTFAKESFSKLKKLDKI